MLLYYPNFLRVVITSANFIDQDWIFKTQVWPVFVAIYNIALKNKKP